MRKWLTALLAIGPCVTGVSIVSAAGDSGGTPTCATAASDPDGDGWGWENNASCRVAEESGSSANNSSSNNANNDCDYTDAHLHNGWGWNPITNQSCEPTNNTPTPNNPQPPNNDCDYTDAHLHNGWGWNPITNQSCEPTNNTPAPNNPQPPLELIDLYVAPHLGATVVSWDEPSTVEEPTYTLTRYESGTGEIVSRVTTTDKYVLIPESAQPSDLFQVVVIEASYVPASSAVTNVAGRCLSYCDADEFPGDIFVGGNGEVTERPPVAGVPGGIESIDCCMPVNSWLGLARAIAQEAILRPEFEDLFGLDNTVPFLAGLPDVPTTDEGLIVQNFANTNISIDATTGERTQVTFYGSHENFVMVETVSTPDVTQPAFVNGEPMFDDQENRIHEPVPNSPVTNVVTVRDNSGNVLSQRTTVTSPTGGTYEASTPSPPATTPTPPPSGGCEDSGNCPDSNPGNSPGHNVPNPGVCCSNIGEPSPSDPPGHNVPNPGVCCSNNAEPAQSDEPDDDDEDDDEE